MNIPMVSALLMTLAFVPFGAGVLLATWRQRRLVARRSRDLTIEVGPKVLLGFALAGVGTAPALASTPPTASSGSAAWLPELDRGPILDMAPGARVVRRPPAMPSPARPRQAIRQPLPVEGDQATGSAAYVVRHGDSLWSITAQHLGPHARVRDIAALWPQLYEANRAVIGSNPRLLIPGQRLVLPSGFTVGSR